MVVFSPGGTPNTRDLVMQMTKKVDNPRKKEDSEEKGAPVDTLYDNMMFRRSTDGVVNYPSGGIFLADGKLESVFEHSFEIQF